VEVVDMVSQKRPIAQKLIKEFRKFKERKVFDFKQIDRGRKTAEDLQKTVASTNELAEMHPAHALYVYAQNQMSVLSEQVTQLRGMSRFVDLVGTAEDEYLPSGPPMSPLTTSYFTCWAMFDACIGLRRETIGSCTVALASEIGLNPDLLRLIKAMQESRMGIYFLQGFEEDCAVLREMVTGIECRAIVPSGYRGGEGELWFVRVLPPPLPGRSPHVVFTTPYLILKPGPEEWLAYFARTLPKIDAANEVRAYERLMKYGPDRNYWNEYIFEAYVNHRAEVIFIAGLPDVEESRPHSRMNS
jgi:hypothetical protein